MRKAPDFQTDLQGFVDSGPKLMCCSWRLITSWGHGSCTSSKGTNQISPLFFHLKWITTLPSISVNRVIESGFSSCLCWDSKASISSAQSKYSFRSHELSEGSSYPFHFTKYSIWRQSCYEIAGTKCSSKSLSNLSILDASVKDFLDNINLFVGLIIASWIVVWVFWVGFVFIVCVRHFLEFTFRKHKTEIWSNRGELNFHALAKRE